jgi:glyoxylase I family protein
MGRQAVPSCTGFHHAALTVRDLDESARWYERVFDLEIVMDEAAEQRAARVYRLLGTSTWLGLVEHQANEGAPFSPTRTGLDHLAIDVAQRADIDDWVAHLDTLGVEHSGAIDTPWGAILNFPDPDGIQLSIFWER